MVGMEYWCSFDSTAMTIADDIGYVAAPTDAVVFIEEIWVTNTNLEDSNQLELCIFKTATDQAAVGSGVTPSPLESGFPAAGSVVRDTRGGASATQTNIAFCEGQNILNGWAFKGSYEEPLLILSPTAGVAGRFVFRLNSAPAMSTAIAARLKIREIGG